MTRLKNVEIGLLVCLFGTAGYFKAPIKKWDDGRLSKLENMEQSTTAMDINDSPNDMDAAQSASEVELQTGYSIDVAGTFLQLHHRSQLTCNANLYSYTHAEHHTDNVEEQSSSSSIATNIDNAANLVAVFVSRFDIHSGNMIEWQYPSGENISNVVILNNIVQTLTTRLFQMLI